MQYAVVQYLFDNGIEVPVVIPPYGNSKKATSSYRRIQKSTFSRMREIQGTPIVIISAVHKEAGGVLRANSASELPCNRCQVYNQHSFSSVGKNQDNTIDPIFELVQQCKVDLSPGGRILIRSVSFDTSRSCVLATEGQLNDVVRFCTNPCISCVFGIDPTFNLGKFYVTVTTFTYSHVINKCGMKLPTFLALCLCILSKIMTRIIAFSLLS